jgi:hypothetical protein
MQHFLNFVFTDCSDNARERQWVQNNKKVLSYVYSLQSEQCNMDYTDKTSVSLHGYALFVTVVWLSIIYHSSPAHRAVNAAKQISCWGKPAVANY